MDEHEVLDILIKFESFIKSKYVLCHNYDRLRECDPPKGYIIDRFLKDLKANRQEA